jgi:death-on-curing protein
METFLVLNGAEIDASPDEQERVMLDLAAGRIDRGQLVAWLRQHLKPLA